MKTCSFLLLSYFLLFCNEAIANNEQGGQFKDLGQWEVHYIAFPSTVLQPRIAKYYGIERSNYNAVVNISVLDKKTKKAQKVALTGAAKNLVGTSKKLNFNEIIDGESIYYIATLSYNNEETFRFIVDLMDGEKSEKLTFNQKFYVD